MLRTWMGDLGRLRALEIKMIAFNVAGTVVTSGGRVTSIEPAEPGSGGTSGTSGGTATVELWMRSDDVLTVTGTAVLELPTPSAEPRH
jgi:hypothetical protein